MGTEQPELNKMERLLLLSVLLHLGTSGTVRYVDQNKAVTGKRDGTWAAPFKKISDCAKLLSGPGDECQVRAGEYHEDIVVKGVRGEEDNPAVITGYKDERPVIDGTVEIKPVEGKWDVSGGKYSGEIGYKIWQFFIGDTMMTNARWPNAKFSDQGVFDGDKWAQTGDNCHIDVDNEEGTIENRGSALKDSNLNVQDAIAVMNIGKWNTFVTKVEHHEAQDNSFTYHHTFGDFEIETGLSRYFLEDKLELLDVAEEWHHDKDSKVLTFIPPVGTDMSTATLRGKVQTYAITITDSQHLLIKNLEFFATTIKASSSSKTEYVDKITLDSLKFMYPSYSKRMLGEIGLIEWTDLSGKFKGKKPDGCCGSFKFINNYFYGSDGVALAYHGDEGSTLENNYFKHNDWTSANMIRYGGGMATIFSDSVNDVIKRNTLVDNGNGCGIRPGRTSNITLNHITGQCFGFQQNDGAGIQVTVKPQKDVRIEKNWVMDSPKYGIRFDGERPKIGEHGNVMRNVVMMTNGVNLKGDYHKAINNFVVESDRTNSKEGKCSLCMWKTVRRNLGVINQHSTVINNIADVANGGFVFIPQGDKIIQVKDENGKLAVWPLQGTTVDNNLVGFNYRDLVMDPDNMDFRPVKKSLADKNKVGPYERSARFYWIPGRQEEKTSSPVPPNGSTNVVAGRRRHVMWLNAYKSSNHQVYFGTDEKKVESATTSSTEYIGEVKGGGNVKQIPAKSKVKPGNTYYWRVDAKIGSTVIKGDVWEFSTI